jgi:hypothetical protein
VSTEETALRRNAPSPFRYLDEQAFRYKQLIGKMPALATT